MKNKTKIKYFIFLHIILIISSITGIISKWFKARIFDRSSL